MTTPAPRLTWREREAIGRLLCQADALGEAAQRALEEQFAVRERELVRWAGDAQRAGVASPVIPPEVYVRAGIAVQFLVPQRPNARAAAPVLDSRIPGFPDSWTRSGTWTRRYVHRGMAARIRPGRPYVQVQDITDASTRLVAVGRLRPVTFPRPAYAVFRRYLRLVVQGRLAAGRPRVWLHDELSSVDAQKRLRQRDRCSVAQILREADEMSLTAQRELWWAFAARERSRRRRGGSRTIA